MRNLLYISLIWILNASVVAQTNDFSFSICKFAPSEISALNAPFDMNEISKPEIPANEFNILNFGAEQSHLFRIDKALSEAIKSASSIGGGRIIIPSGVWSSGSIHLDNNIELHFEDGAVIYFSINLEDYLPAVFSRHQGIECYKFSSLIYANGKTNIAITGNGILHGQGKGWWKYNDRREIAWKTLEKMAEENHPVEQRVFADTLEHFLAPSFIQPINCTNLLIEGITIKYGPFWTINPVYCENIIIRKVKVITEGDYGHTKNGDGINLSSCTNALIEYCDLSTGDDCITLKSGRGADGIRIDKPTKNVVIRFCQARQGHGGVVVGSETSGGICNIFINQCSFYGTDRGIRIKTARGRGATVESIFVSDISMENIIEEAVIVNMLRYTSRFPVHPVSNETPTFRNIYFDNIQCKSANYGIRLVGLPENPMQNIHFNKLNLSSNYGFSATDVLNVKIANSTLISNNPQSIKIVDCQLVELNNVGIIEGKEVAIEGSKVETIIFKNCEFTNDKNWLKSDPKMKNKIIIQ